MGLLPNANAVLRYKGMALASAYIYMYIVRASGVTATYPKSSAIAVFFSVVANRNRLFIRRAKKWIRTP